MPKRWLLGGQQPVVSESQTGGNLREYDMKIVAVGSI